MLQSTVTKSDEASAWLLVANDMGIWKITSNGSSHMLIEGNTPPSGVDYHYEKGRIFWTDSKQVYTKYLRDRNSYPTVVIQRRKTWQLTSIAIDFINDKIYVLDKVGLEVGIFELDGTNETYVLQQRLNNPKQIVVDPYNGYMFVVDIHKVRSFGGNWWSRNTRMQN